MDSVSSSTAVALGLSERAMAKSASAMTDCAMSLRACSRAALSAARDWSVSSGTAPSTRVLS